MLSAPERLGRLTVADVGPSAHHAAFTHLEPEASHGLNLEDSVAPSENRTKRKRAWGVADEVDEVNTESEKVDNKADSSISRLNLSSESDSSDASGDGDGSEKDGNVPSDSETVLGEDWSKLAKTRVVCSDVVDEPDDTFELKGAQAHIVNPCKSSTEEPDAKSVVDQLGQIRRDLQALRAMLEPVITFINTPCSSHRLPPVVKTFVATPFFYKQLASAKPFAVRDLHFGQRTIVSYRLHHPQLVLTKSGLVPTEAYNKNPTFRHNLLSNIPALLVQGRSDLLRLGHINKAQKDKITLGRTMQQWYKGQQVAITEEHITWWGVLWQVTKAPNVLNPRDSKANSFANKLKRYGSTAGHNTLCDHIIQVVCSEVVNDPVNNLSFASRVADAVQEMGANPGKARKKKKPKTTKDEKQIEEGQP
ncbi:BQ5605_C041g11953 [Microbotryum silenes-dioicae]|uniref:BQ5605_C041g11953 protein n=1 Tax=Microbotryum silenes-dioicae TaxID=796604 RepID=A0A2X0NIN1_9BASI|nr:BQ5605_C041g11953 [Microbotryum silenes-dioicae]